MNVVIAIHKDKRNNYGVTIPDLPGCVTAAKSYDQAIHEAKEAIECHLEGLLKDGDKLPVFHTLEEHLQKKKHKIDCWALVEIDLDRIYGSMKRINITIPSNILKLIDQYLEKRGGNRSAFLTEAAIRELHQNGAPGRS